MAADSDGWYVTVGLGTPRPCTGMGCCVLVGEHTFSEEQEEMYVDTSSAALQFSEAWPMAWRVVRRFAGEVAVWR